MQRRAVAIRHVAFEDLGLLGPILEEHGYTVEYRDAGVEAVDVPPVRDANIVIVLGGPVGVYDVAVYPCLAEELRLLEYRCTRDLPTLGICLGAQLLAYCLGGDVRPMNTKEIGFGAVELSPEGARSPLVHLQGVPVLHWHGDQYSLPAGARRLASTELCPEQAFEYGSNIFALQFHPEWELRTFERWLIGHAVELAHAGIDPRDLRAAAQRVAPVSMPAGRQALASWIGTR